MTKWDYIQQISELRKRCGGDCVLDLLEWCDKPNTASVTLEEARAFLELRQGQLEKRRDAKKALSAFPG